jgi:hypothetical protein
VGTTYPTPRCFFGAPTYATRSRVFLYCVHVIVFYLVNFLPVAHDSACVAHSAVVYVWYVKVLLLTIVAWYTVCVHIDTLCIFIVSLYSFPLSLVPCPLSLVPKARPPEDGDPTSPVAYNIILYKNASLLHFVGPFVTFAFCRPMHHFCIS